MEALKLRNVQRNLEELQLQQQQDWRRQQVVQSWLATRPPGQHMLVGPREFLSQIHIPLPKTTIRSDAPALVQPALVQPADAQTEFSFHNQRFTIICERANGGDRVGIYGSWEKPWMRGISTTYVAEFHGEWFPASPLSLLHSVDRDMEPDSSASMTWARFSDLASGILVSI